MLQLGELHLAVFFVKISYQKHNALGQMIFHWSYLRHKFSAQNLRAIFKYNHLHGAQYQITGIYLQMNQFNHQYVGTVHESSSQLNLLTRQSTSHFLQLISFHRRNSNVLLFFTPPSAATQPVMAISSSLSSKTSSCVSSSTTHFSSFTVS